jgi:YVTN family beta-propeller protein
VALLIATLAPGALARNAYVTENLNSVSVLETQTNQILGTPITVGNGPTAVAITPNGRFAYILNYDSNSVSVIDVQTNQVVGSPIMVGTYPVAIAITPNGRFAYVTNSFSKSVSVIDTQTNQVVGAITVGEGPTAVAISPDGRFAYVTILGTDSVSVIDTQTNQVVGSPITVGTQPAAIAITPDGRLAYVSNSGSAGMPSETVSVIDTQTNQVVGSPITVGKAPRGIAITPDGARAYVTVEGTNSVAVIDTHTNQLIGSPIAVGNAPVGIAITPDGARAYVTPEVSKSVSVIDTQTNQAGSPIVLESFPDAIAITPDQPPRAAFLSARGRPGVPVALNASASSDPDGTIASYGWAFGDGQTMANGGPGPSHVYSAPGSYQATLTLTDNEGCSTEFIFTGQTASCNGSKLASQTQSVTVAYPGVGVNCPKSARPKGCKFKLQAVAKKPKKDKKKTTSQSAVARAKLKAGQSTIVSLIPKSAFVTKLATATNVLVMETVTIKASKRTFFRKLKIVQ